MKGITTIEAYLDYLQSVDAKPSLARIVGEIEREHAKDPKARWCGSCRVMVHDGRRTERSDFIEGESYQGTAAASLALCLGSGFLAEEMRSWLASTRTPED